jgi:hypothetical protein
MLAAGRFSPRLSLPAGARRLGLCVAGGLALGVVLTVTWWLASASVAGGAESFEVVVPEGTAEAIAAGQAPPSLPSRIGLREGDRLVVRNLDSVDHRIGWLTIEAGSSAEVPPSSLATRNQLVCTFHVAGSIDVDVATKRSASVLLWGSLMVGLPLAAATYLVLTITSRL